MADLEEEINSETNRNEEQPYMTTADYNRYAVEKMEEATVEQKQYLDKYIAAARQRQAERLQQINVDLNMQRIYSLTGDGGTGKTRCYNVYFVLRVII